MHVKYWGSHGLQCTANMDGCWDITTWMPRVSLWIKGYTVMLSKGT